MNNEEEIIDRKSLGRPDYMGLPNDSDEELFFLYWCEELVQKGIIISVERAVPFILSSKLTHNYLKKTQLKKKVKEEWKQETILHEHIYTPEFKIVWNNKLAAKFLGTFYDEFSIKSRLISSGANQSDMTTIFTEIKPIFDDQNMRRLFILNQKWVWSRYQHLVNLVIINKLFEQTFCPKKWLLTPTGKISKRKINFKVRTLEEFLNLTENDIQNTEGRNPKIL